MRHNILVVGCGNIGLKLALKLASKHQVYGLKRNTANLPSNINGIAADVTQPLSLRDKLPSSIDYIVYCLTASTFSDPEYKKAYVDGLSNLIDEINRTSSAPKRLFFVSSSSVYQQDNDQIVNEDTLVAPERFSGQRLLEAEQVALSSPFPATNIRFSGIYGRTRTRLLEQVANGSAKRNSVAYTNRIHEDDCVLVLEHLIEQDITGITVEDCYLASDSAPVRMNDLIEWISDQLNVPKIDSIPVDATSIPVGASNEGKRRAGSKRCSNERLKKSGYKFKYPSFREGYKEMIEDFKQRRPDS